MTMKILIEVPTWLGDCVMATPSLRNIINEYKNPSISLLGTKTSLDLFREDPLISEYVVIRKNYFQAIKQFIGMRNYDLFISFRSSFRTKLLMILLKVKEKHQYNKNSFPSGHQVQKYNNFVNSIIGHDLPPGKLQLRSFAKNKQKEVLIGINPGAAYGSAKMWKKEGYVDLSINLSKKGKIFLFGGKNEVDLANQIEDELKKNNINNYLNLAGKTSISQLMSLISRLDLFITGDSGPMHIAAAYKIPTVSIFGPTKDHETCQWMNPKSIILKKELVCQPCMKRVCPLKHHNCMENITSKEVMESALSLI